MANSTVVAQYYAGIFRVTNPSQAVLAPYIAAATDAAALSMMLNAADVQVDPVVRLYQTAFNRVPDSAGLTGWVQAYVDGPLGTANGGAGTSTLLQIANGFVGSVEFEAVYGPMINGIPGGNAAGYVAALYQNILQRQGDPAGTQGWVDALQSGKATAAQVLIGFSQSAEFIANISSGVDGFLSNCAQGTETYTGTLFSQGTPAYTTYTLTAQPETISGSNIIVNGVVDLPVGAAADSSTLTVADTLTGTGGTNTLNVTSVGTITGFNNALISGFQVINLRATAATGNIDMSAAGITGLTNFNAVGLAPVQVSNLNAGAAYGVSGSLSGAVGAQQIGYAANATAAVVNLNGSIGAVAPAPAITVTGANLASTTVNSTGAANTVGILTTVGTSVTINAAASLTATSVVTSAAATLNINGAAASVNIGTLSVNVDTVNASGMTVGGLTATLGLNSANVTGGAGDDTITTGRIVLTTGSVDAGGGTGDNLIVTSAGDVAATPAAKYTNFEILTNRAGASLAASGIAGITTLQMDSAGGGFTGMSAAQALNVTNLGDNAAATLALTTATGTSDVLTVNLTSKTSTATKADLTGVTITGFETMNVVSNTGAAASISTLSFAAAGNLSTLNLSGAAPIVVSTTNITNAAGTVINASAMTFAGTALVPTFQISGNLVKGSSVLGSNQADKITTTAAAVGAATDFVTYNAGGGDDVIISTVAAINNNGGATASLKIDGGLGTDTLQLAVGTAVVDANFQYLTNLEVVEFTGAGAVSITTGANFDTNFANGVSVLGQTGGSKGASLVDLTNYTKDATVTMLQAGAGAGGAAGDSFAISTGTGADTVNLTTALALTTLNTVTTGAGNDTINITQTLAITAGSVVVNAGVGADAITLSTTANGKEIIVQTMGDSVAATANTFAALLGNGNTITFGNGVDVVTNFTSADDSIDADVAGLTGGAYVADGALLASTAQTTNYAIRGTYANGVFTIDTLAGTDTLLSLGKAGSALTFADTTDYVVVVGVTDLTAANIV